MRNSSSCCRLSKLQREFKYPNNEMEVEENGEQRTQEEEVVEVDVDSTDGAVLVNSNKADEEWGTTNEGNLSS
ncbi:hypothetical protein C5167_004075 [Papaver somniferum]|nr:hypothetical protein C5167_004075 [Papaver somniferum]